MPWRASASDAPRARRQSSAPTRLSSETASVRGTDAVEAGRARAAPLLAFYCSNRCPATIVVHVYDVALALRHAGVAVVSGFHTLLEREALHVLLKGSQPIVACPARSVAAYRAPAAWRPAIEAGRLRLTSPFPAGVRRATAELARQRNRFVAELAAALLVAYASPGGETEALALEALAAGKPVLVFDSPHNRPLMDGGARPVTAATVIPALATIGISSATPRTPPSPR